jgi:hypothetical protein
MDSFRLQTMTAFNKKFLRMFHGAVFSKSAPLAAGGKNIFLQLFLKVMRLKGCKVQEVKI